jgi:hypothetical protein
MALKEAGKFIAKRSNSLFSFLNREMFEFEFPVPSSVHA